MEEKYKDLSNLLTHPICGIIDGDECIILDSEGLIQDSYSSKWY